MPTGPNNVYPFTIAAGSFDASSGALVAGGAYGIAASAMVRSAKGVYTVTLGAGSPPAANISIRFGTTGPNMAASITSYVASTGVITFAGTDLANGLLDVGLWFEVLALGSD